MSLIAYCLGIFNQLHKPMICVSIIALVVTGILAENISPVIVAGAFFAAGVFMLRISFRNDNEGYRHGIRLYSFVYFFSVLATCLIYLYYMNIYGVPYESGGTDDRAFENAAYSVLSSGLSSYGDIKLFIAGEGTGTWNLAGNYSLFIAFVHKAVSMSGFEPHTLNPRFFNVLFLALSAVLVWRIAKRCCEDERASIFAGYYAGLFPGVVFCAAHVYRDVLIGFGLVFATWLVFQILDQIQSPGKKHPIALGIGIVIALVVSVVVFSTLRTNISLLFLSIIFGIFTTRIESPILKYFIVPLVLVSLLLGFKGEALQQYTQEGMRYFDYYTDYRASQGGESGIGTAIYRQTVLISVPLRIIYASIVPVPFPVGVWPEDCKRLGTFVWFFSLPFLLLALWRSLKPQKSLKGLNLQSVAISFLLPYLLVALITLQTRHITMYLPMGSVLIASQLERERSWNPIILKIMMMTFVGVFVVILYFVEKLL